MEFGDFEWDDEKNAENIKKTTKSISKKLLRLLMTTEPFPFLIPSIVRSANHDTRCSECASKVWYSFRLRIATKNAE